MGNRGRAELAALKEKHVQEWRASRLSKSEYCEQHGLNVKTFYRWLTPPKLSNQKSTINKPVKAVPLIPISVISEAEPGYDLPASSSAGIRIHVREKFVVELAIGFDAVSLKRLWQTWADHD